MVQIENASENEKEEKKMIKSGKTIAITNRKGGSGKTTTAKNIAYDLTLCNKKVLLIDLDPQCNATEGLSGRKYSRSVIGMLQLENVHKCIYKTRFNDLDILPGNDYLASTEILDDVLYRQISPLRNEYDFIIIDTSPYFNKLTAEILKISDLVIIPTLLEDDSLKGVMTTIQELITLFDGDIRCKVLPTMVDKTKYTEKLLLGLKEDIGNMCFDTYIRENKIQVRRARQHHSPLSYRYRKSKAAKDYEKLTAELLEVM